MFAVTYKPKPTDFKHKGFSQYPLEGENKMTYKDNFVVVIKSNGKILRESNGEVLLPFGSEYEILLKNLDSRRAVASVSIDGKDVLGGVRVIVPANESVELKGEMDGSKVRYKFKFIEKTEQISEYRGDRVEDGLVRVEVWFEESYNSNNWTWTTPIIYPWYQPSYPQWTYTSTETGGAVGRQISHTTDNTGGFATGGVVDNTPILMSCCNQECAIPKGDGITVKGSDVKQDFGIGYTNTLESQSTVITLCLKGYKGGKVVSKPMFTTTKYVCPTCGKHNKSLNKFCNGCGTRLQY